MARDGIMAHWDLTPMLMLNVLSPNCSCTFFFLFEILKYVCHYYPLHFQSFSMHYFLVCILFFSTTAQHVYAQPQTQTQQQHDERQREEAQERETAAHREKEAQGQQDAQRGQEAQKEKERQEQREREAQECNRMWKVGLLWCTVSCSGHIHKFVFVYIGICKLNKPQFSHALHDDAKFIANVQVCGFESELCERQERVSIYTVLCTYCTIEIWA
jgi:hypothetical protein